MNDFLHVLDRFIVHFFSASSLVMLTFFALRTLDRRIRSEWLPDDWKPLLGLAAVTVFAVASLREAWDVAQGQALGKALTDYASWLLGCGVSTWGLARFKTDK